MNNHDVIISGVHLELTEALKNMVMEKINKLFKHEERIIRLRVELEFQHKKNHDNEYIAKGHISINGPGITVSATTEDLYKSIDQMVEKLDRQLRKRSRLQRVKRKNTQNGLDIPATLPKLAA